jgi:hypothetical protein
MIKEDQYYMSGSLKISINDTPKIKLVLDKKRIIVDILSLSEIINHNSNLGLFKRLKDGKIFANILAEKGLTIFIVRNGIEVSILGKEAKPRISKYITKNKYIEIRNLKELRKLDKL